MLTRTLAAFCASTLLASVGLASEPVELRFKWTKGEPVVYRQTEERFTFNPLPSPSESKGETPVLRNSEKTTSVVRIEPEETRPSGATFLRITFESARGGASGSARDDLHDDPDWSAMHEQFLRTPPTVLVAGTGKVMAVEGLDRILEKLPAEARAEQSAMEDMFKAALEMASFERLPDRPVSPGESWSVSHDMPLMDMGSMRTDITYTLREVAEAGGTRLARIDVFRRVAFQPSPCDDGAELLGLDFPGTVGVGQFIFDVDRGRVERSELQMHGGGERPPLSLGESAPGPRWVLRAVRERVTADKPAAKP